MNARTWRGGLLAVALVVTLAGGSGAVASAGPAGITQTTLSPPEQGSLDDTGLAIAHRLPGGGMNLWRLPLVWPQLGQTLASPRLLERLDFGGFSYDRSVVLAGNFANVSGADDRSTDEVIWHAQPNG